MTLKYGSGFTVALSDEFVADCQEDPTEMTDTEPPIDTPPAEPSASGRTRGPMLGFASGVAAFGVCCGLSILGSVGVAGVVLGIGAGSWLAVAVASIAVVIGVVRNRSRRTCHSPIDTTNERPAFPVAGGEGLRHQGVLR